MGRVWPQHGGRGGPLNSEVRLHVDPLPHIKQDPDYVDIGALAWVWIISVVLAFVAWLLFESGYVVAAVILGATSAIGISIPRIPYSAWRKRLARPNGNEP